MTARTGLVNDEPGFLPLAMRRASRIVDAAGVLLLAWLGWRMFFDFDSSLQNDALLIAGIGIAAMAGDREARRNIPIAMLAYVAVALLSAAVHRWDLISRSGGPVWSSLFAPAHHLIVMAAFVYGAAYLLRTPSRLSWFAVLLMLSTIVLAAQIAFDRAIAGFYYYERGGPSLPSVPHWGGIHGTSLALTIGFPFAAIGLATRRSVSRFNASLILAGALFFVSEVNGSRGGLVAMFVVLGSVVFAGSLEALDARRRARVLGACIAVFTAVVIVAVWLFRAYVPAGADFSGRTILWNGTARLIADFPWLGVGPGNYGHAINATGYIADFPGVPQNAHNLLLHTTAEIGVIGGFCLLLLLGWAIRACWRAWSAGNMPMVSVATLLALEGFLVHSLSENYFDARVAVERTRLIVWMLLAVSLALDRLPRARVDHV